MLGAGPGRPFQFTIPATGDEPITFAARGLPQGLVLDSKLGRITGVTPSEPGDICLTLSAVNMSGTDTKQLLIKVGDQICLTPPMGWNSWNCFAGAVDADKVRAAAHAMVDSGLIKHGWTYINIDDTWQGQRGGPFNGIQGNEKFPDMKQLCDEIHALGLKAGIYSTPWATSYASYTGGSAENPEGTWSKPDDSQEGKRQQEDPSLGGRQILLRHQRRQAMGRLGLRLSEIRLESDRDAAGAGNGRCAEEPAAAILFSACPTAPRSPEPPTGRDCPTAGAPPAISATLGQA